jgi:hypothetical protein
MIRLNSCFKTLFLTFFVVLQGQAQYNVGNGGGGAIGCFEPLSALPIELLSFTSSCDNEMGIVLEWLTATELNNDFFTIERSIDAINFESIGEVQGQGNSAYQHTYYFRDMISNGGITYYRLKQTDFNGAFTYSEIIAENCEEYFSYLIYPNPMTDVLYIQAQQSTNDIYFEIIDFKGSIVKQSYFAKSTSVSVSDLSAGIYTLRLSNKNKEQFFKIVKK